MSVSIGYNEFTPQERQKYDLQRKREEAKQLKPVSTSIVPPAGYYISPAEQQKYKIAATEYNKRLNQYKQDLNKAWQQVQANEITLSNYLRKRNQYIAQMRETAPQRESFYQYIKSVGPPEPTKAEKARQAQAEAREKIHGPTSLPKPGSVGEKLKQKTPQAVAAFEAPFLAVTNPVREASEYLRRLSLDTSRTERALQPRTQFGTETPFSMEQPVMVPSEARPAVGFGAYVGSVGLDVIAAGFDVATFPYRPGLMVGTALALTKPKTYSDIAKSATQDPFRFVSTLVGASWVGGGISSGMDTAFSKLPKIKYGKTTIPLTAGGKIDWSGYYLDYGKSTKKLTGTTFIEDLSGTRTKLKTVGVTDYSILPDDGLGYIPQTEIESLITIDAMKALGYPSTELAKVSNVRDILFKAEKIPSMFIDDLLPEETGTLSEKGIVELKQFLLENPDGFERLYGSFAARNQLDTSFEFVLADVPGVTALRKPADIDIVLTGNIEAAEKFIKKLNKRLQDAGEETRVSPTKPTMIEAKGTSKNWVHAIDAHLAGYDETASAIPPIPPMRWGFKTDQPNIEIENFPVQPLSEQGVRKGTVILGFGEKNILGPASWRRKDVVDFVQISQTLEGSRGFGTPSFQENIDTIVELYGVTDLKATALPDMGPEIFTFYPKPSKASKAKVSSGAYQFSVFPQVKGFTSKVPSYDVEYKPSKASLSERRLVG